MKVLIVEDYLPFRKLLENQLLFYVDKLNVHQAGTIEDTVNLLGQNDYHLIILDVNLPDGYSSTLIPKIKEKNQNTIIIVLTGNSSNFIRLKVNELGADYFLDKMTDLEQLFIILK
ncbi:MAG: response regulator, partial [Ignavibacteriaceae bacterium]|nr:response regulator [Ignavibacteriaceae bacterium]